jgi:hypothetical protein
MALMRYLKQQRIHGAALLVLSELVMLGNLDAASAGSTGPASYWVTVRQTGMIDGLYAYVGFRSDRQTLPCGPLEFISFQIRPLPAHDEDGLCDTPASTDSDGFGLRHPVLKSFPAFAALRIDVRSRDNGNGR